MPPTPSTPRRSSYNRRSAPVTPKSNTPKPEGLYDLNSVQDRIKQWQSQGAAAAPAPDADSILSNPASDIERLDRRERRSQLSNNKENPEAIESTAKRRSGRIVDRDSKESVRDIRSSSTPRKRVISDTNWKVKIKSKEPRSSNATPRQESRTRDLDSDVERTRSPAEIEREERRRRMREARKSRRCDDERLKEIYGTSTPPTIDPQVPYEDPETQRNVDSDLARRFTRPTKDRDPSHIVDRQESIRPEDDDGRHRRRSKYAETLGSGANSSDVHTSSKQRKGSIFNKTKEMFAKTEQPPTMSSRLPSIAAWLEEQPDDPFVDDGEAPVEVPPPLKPRTRRRVSAEAKVQIVEDPNIIWKNLTKEITPPHRRRKRKSRENDQRPPRLSEDTLFTGCVPVHDILPQTPDQSPGVLKRRGARLSRLRDRPLGRNEKTAECSPAPPPEAQSSPSPPPVSKIVDARSDHEKRRLKPEEFPDKPCPPIGNRRLSTIASVETFTNSIEHLGQNEQNGETWDFLKLDGNGLKRRLTTHEDLMSQLSMPIADKSLRKTRSKKRAQSQASNMTTQEVFDGVKEDEAKYVRELRTLVDGVIPVLLQCVLSKSDSVTAVGLFTSSTNGKDVTRPIVDMGIALERLKSLHSRIPTHHLEGLLAWAHSAHKAYSDYLKAWRLGFQDVVVNLATNDGNSSEVDKGMPRDQNGDVVNADGKKVDVAYLLKRPLVRIKKLSKSLADLKAIVNTSSADKVAIMYENLTDLARKRTQEEQGRLEDEAAANVDATKARDLRTMTVLAGLVAVNKSRKVKAKDCFSMTLYHTSGQRVDCRIEIILRDDHTSLNAGGDVLFCEMDDTGKWLLFPPVDMNTVSARKGDKPEDLVVMVRGTGRQAWHEMLELKADDVETANEWMHMLGSNPLPPKLVRSSSFLAREEAEKYASKAAAKPLSAEALKQINGSDIEIPIGEPSVLGFKEDRKRQVSPRRQLVDKPLPKLNLGGGLQKSSQQSWSSPTSSSIPPRKPVGSGSVVSSDRSTYSAPSTTYSSSSHTPTISSTSVEPEVTPRKLNKSHDMSKEWKTSPELTDVEAAKAHGESIRAKAAAPSMDLPTLARIRGASGQPASITITSSIADQWDSTSGGGKDHSALPSRLRREKGSSRGAFITEDVTPLPAHRERPMSMPAAAISVREPQREMGALQPLSDNLVMSKPSKKSTQQTDKKAKRLSSSPLKHEYAPSVASSEDSDGSTSEASDLLSEDEDTPTPLVPVAEMRRPSRAAPPSAFRQPSGSKTATLAPSDSASQAPYRSVPSVSASEKRKAIAMVCTWSYVGTWVPVNPTGEICSVIVSAGLVEVFETSTTHVQPLSNNSSPVSSRENSLTLRPLVGFELTINVMMHGGTGLDITLRSPPTPNSRIKNASSTVLFRSSSMAEKQLLYHILNQARMNNPTMLALMAARAKKERAHPPAVKFALGEPARHSRASSFGIFGLGRSSKGSGYRASSATAPQSISGDTTESTGSTSRNLLKRLSAGSAFALNRSSVLKKAPGTVASSSLSGSSTPANSQSGYIPTNGPNAPTTSNAAVEGAGMVNNMKVRLHVREKNKDKWLDLGAVRLSILPVNAKISASDQSPPESGSNTPTRPRSISGTPTATPRMPSASYRTADPPSSKRIVIVGAGNDKDRDKTWDKSNGTAGKQQTFLDASLPEAAFERIQRIGIAINVWKEEERIAQQGGVLLGRNTVWCVSFGSERECAWVFGLVGRYR